MILLNKLQLTIVSLISVVFIILILVAAFTGIFDRLFTVVGK